MTRVINRQKAAVKLMLTSGLLVASIIPTHAAEADWKRLRDAFLGPDQHIVKRNCLRGEEANAEGLSAFNDAWVEEMRTLRINAGVSTIKPDGSNHFFRGLATAMRQSCPAIW